MATPPPFVVVLAGLTRAPLRAEHTRRRGGWCGCDKWGALSIVRPCARRSRPAARDRAPHSGVGVRFQFDQTADGRVLKLFDVVDESTGEALVMLVERSIDAERTAEVWSAWSPSAQRLSICAATTARR